VAVARLPRSLDYAHFVRYARDDSTVVCYARDDSVKTVDIEQILPFEVWERVRPVLRPLFIHEKTRRRLTLGAHLTFLFENAQSVWYQVEEMLRVERIGDRAAIRHEIDTYNELIPREDELSATLLIEYSDAAERDLALKGLAGLERHVHLNADGRKVDAVFAGSQISADAVSSVQFVRFPLPRGLGEKLVELAERGALSLEVDHPMLAARAAIDVALAQALREDLTAS